jgi:hypothetical protein
MLLQDPRLDFYITKGRQVQALGRAGREPNFDWDGELTVPPQHHQAWGSNYRRSRLLNLSSRTLEAQPDVGPASGSHRGAR